MGKADTSTREERLAAQLRANLKRRKAQNREKEARENAARTTSQAEDSQAPPLPKGESTG